MNFVWFIIIGIIAGWAAGRITRGGGFGLIVNFIVGIIGSLIGGWLFSLIGYRRDYCQPDCSSYRSHYSFMDSFSLSTSFPTKLALLTRKCIVMNDTPS